MMATNNSVYNPVTANGLTNSNNNITTVNTTKGDIIVGSGSSTATRLPIGTDYNVLTADSGATNGLDWEAGLSGTTFPRIFGYGNSASNFALPASQISNSTTTAYVANKLYCVPIVIGISATFTSIGQEITTLKASSEVRLGIYKANGPNGFPGDLVLDAGKINSGGTGILTIGISQTLLGPYYLVFICNDTPSARQTSATSNEFAAILGVNSDVSFSANISSLTETGVSSYFTALPSTLRNDTFTMDNQVPVIFLKV